MSGKYGMPPYEYAEDDKEYLDWRIKDNLTDCNNALIVLLHAKISLEMPVSVGMYITAVKLWPQYFTKPKTRRKNEG